MCLLVLLVFLLITQCLCLGQEDERSTFTPLHLRELKNRTLSLFQHGWNSYIEFGFPADEVRPLSCEPYGPQFTHADNNHLDAMGNVSLTVLDNLDTLMMLGQWDELVCAFNFLERNHQGFFNQDYVVQVFEASIRWLGGLLLAHLALVDHVLVDIKHQKLEQYLKSYNGFLLNMAYDLGLRLIPAYNTSTNLPLPRINLARGTKGVKSSMNRVGCTAGSTTPFLEFTLLLRLTGDSRFETLTNKTFWKLWATRLELGLLPMTIDPASNRWLDVVTGIGALIDSFYEYAVKGAIVLQESSLWDVFALSYNALMSHSAIYPATNSWMLFANVHVSSPERTNMWIDLLSAFWPGLQVLAGRLSDAVSTHLVFLKIWDNFDSIPERWEQQSHLLSNNSNADRVNAAVSLEWYPLRPEFIESTYYLYRATRDPMYLQIGVRVLTLFESQYKTECGFSGFQDIRSGSKQNRMETFVLGELLKYLYLLFDEANESYVHTEQMKRKNWVFSTEAHPLWYTEKLGNKSRSLFLDNISSQIIPLTEFPSSGLFGSMWLEIINAFGGGGPRPESVRVKSVKTSLFGSELRPVYETYSVCEVQPHQWAVDEKKNFMTSGYCNWSQLFLLNQQLESTLVRPSHLSPYSRNSVIELTPSFQKTYCLAQNAKSARVPTTSGLDFTIGTLIRPEEYEMYRVHATQDDNLFQRNDLVMPRFEGRIKLERLSRNAVTRENKLVPQKYVQKHKTVKWPVDWEVFRIHTVNGYPLSSNNTLWTEGSALIGPLSLFKINEQGIISIDGRFVENLKAF